MPDDLQLQRLESLWREYQSRLGESPDLSISGFADEHPSISGEIRKLFPLMADLGEYAKDPIPAPRQIGEYEIIRQIGVGGMGVVYEASSESLRDRVAIKVVDPASFLKSNRERLRREARLAATLHHSHIVPVFEIGTFENNEYFTMKYIDGPNLSEVFHYDFDDQELSTRELQISKIATELADNWDLQATLMRQAASALAYAHDVDILHRDVKPANFLIDESLKLWVTDFGLAKFRNDDQRSAVRSQVMGTPRYMAPEQLRGEADNRSDIFGLGLTMYEMALLQPTGNNRRHRIWKGGLQPPSKYNPKIPDQLERTIMQAVSLAPEDRQATAQKVVDELDDFLARKSRPAVLEPVPAHRDRSFLSSFSMGKLLLAAIAAIALFGASRFFADLSPDQQDQPQAANALLANTGTNTTPKAGDADSMTPNAVLAPTDKTKTVAVAVNTGGSDPLDLPTKTTEPSDSIANRPPTFAKHMFQSDGKTIVIAKSNAIYPTALDIHDDRDSAFDGLYASIVGGADANAFAMTPNGVLALLHDAESDSPGDRNKDNVYELEVSARDCASVNFVRLVRSSKSKGDYQLIRDRLIRGADFDSTIIAPNCELADGIIDIATADGTTFWHIHRDDEGTVALYQGVLDANGQYKARQLNSNCGISNNTIGLATQDGHTFTVATRGRSNSTRIDRAVLTDDGTFTLSPLSDDSSLNPQIAGLGCLDEQCFQQIRPDGSGKFRFYYSFFIGSRFINMPISDSAHFTDTVMGQAAWLQFSPNSATAMRPIRIKIVDDD